MNDCDIAQSGRITLRCDGGESQTLQRRTPILGVDRMTGCVETRRLERLPHIVAQMPRPNGGNAFVSSAVANFCLSNVAMVQMLFVWSGM